MAGGKLGDELERRFGGIQRFNAEKTLEAIAKVGAREN